MLINALQRSEKGKHVSEGFEDMAQRHVSGEDFVHRERVLSFHKDSICTLPELARIIIEESHLL